MRPGDIGKSVFPDLSIFYERLHYKFTPHNQIDTENEHTHSGNRHLNQPG